LFILIWIVGLGSRLQAAGCGDTNYDGATDTVCACGDTVVGDSGYTYQLTGDLTCNSHGLIAGADDITIDGAGYTITGDGDINDYGINKHFKFKIQDLEGF